LKAEVVCAVDQCGISVSRRAVYCALAARFRLATSHDVVYWTEHLYISINRFKQLLDIAVRILAFAPHAVLPGKPIFSHSSDVMKHEIYAFGLKLPYVRGGGRGITKWMSSF